MRQVVWSFVGLLAVAGPSAAQGALGAMDGVVYDSLHRMPFAGALVALEGAAASARTDSAGRFAFDSLPAGRYTIAVESDVLDSLGVAVSTLTVDVVAGAPRHVTLAVPSRATLLALACRGPALGEESGLLLGVVRDAAGGAPLPGAVVEVRWKVWSFYLGKMVSQDAGIDVRSVAEGAFIACGVPAASQIRVRAVAGARSSAEVQVHVAAFGLARRDLSVGARGEATVRGTITDEAGKPLAGARVEVVGDTAFAMTDERGAYQLAGVTSGTRIVEVRRVSFAPFRDEVDLPAGTPVKLAVVLKPPAPVLAAVVVRAAPGSAGADAAGFEARQKRGMGSFVDRARIAERGNVAAIELLRGVPGVAVQFSEGEAIAIWVRSGGGGCSLTYYLDGVQADPGLLPRSKDIENFEVYPPGESPPRYGGTKGFCAVALFWSRRPVAQKPAAKPPPDSTGTSH